VTDYAALIEQDLAEVRRRLGERPEHPRDGVDDEIDLVVLGEQRELDAHTRALLVHRRTRLEAARERLAAGRYGRCLECGEAIAHRRLLTAPEAERCVGCQARAEQEARGEPERVGIVRVRRPTTREELAEP
jgi:DnaK suppressor protein